MPLLFSSEIEAYVNRQCGLYVFYICTCMRHELFAKDTTPRNLISHKCDIEFQRPLLCWIYFLWFFFSSGVIKVCWGDLKRSLRWGGKIVITAVMQWSRRPSSPSFGPVTVYIKSGIMCCVGAKVMRPLGSNQGWHSPTYSYSNSTASTFTWCLTQMQESRGSKTTMWREKGQTRSVGIMQTRGSCSFVLKNQIKKQFIDKTDRFVWWGNTAAADADLLNPDHTNV